MIINCKCEHESQDKIHGKGRRVGNETLKGSYRCTVCRTEVGDTVKKYKK